MDPPRLDSGEDSAAASGEVSPEMIKEEVDEDSARERDPDDFLEVSVDLGKGKSDLIKVYPGDDVAALVDGFCQRHNIREPLRGKLLAQIQLQLSATEQEPNARSESSRSSENITENAEEEDRANDQLLRSFEQLGSRPAQTSGTHHMKRVYNQGLHILSGQRTVLSDEYCSRQAEENHGPEHWARDVPEGHKAPGRNGTATQAGTRGAGGERGQGGPLPSHHHSLARSQANLQGRRNALATGQGGCHESAKTRTRFRPQAGPGGGRFHFPPPDQQKAQCYG